MTRVTVKSIPVPEWCNKMGKRIIDDFNKQDKKLCLSVYETVDLVQALEEGMYDLVYPECEEAEMLKDLVVDSAKYARYLHFEVTDVYYKAHPAKAKSGPSDRKNPKWHMLNYSEYGDMRPLRIGDYTILHNADNHVTPYCAAYKYDRDTNEWSQGHYTLTLTGALDFAIRNSCDGDTDTHEPPENRKIYIANIIPDDWFDAIQLVTVVNEVYDLLTDIPELEPGHITDALMKLGYSC